MDMADKVELGSTEWLQAAREYLESRIAELGDALNGVKFSLCEVLTDPPAHLLHDGATQLAWQFRFDGKSVAVLPGDSADVDYRQVADYQSILPMARIVYSEDPAALAASRERRKDDNAPALPMVLAPTLLAMHDHLARLTA